MTRARPFLGTAGFYGRYRVPYPKELLEDLLRRADVSGEGILLDLACGPGRVALPQSSSFRTVIAVNEEPEMVQAGQAEARRRGIANVRWVVGVQRTSTLQPARSS